MERHAHFGKYITRVSRDIDESTLARATSSPTTCFLLARASPAERRQIPLCASNSHTSASLRVSASSRCYWRLADDTLFWGRNCGEASL